MSSKLNSTNLTPAPLAVQRQIDSICAKFELGWKACATPELERFLVEIEQPWRNVLLRELLIIELAYRTDESGIPVSNSAMCHIHPALMPGLMEHLAADCNRKPASKTVRNATPTRSPASRDFEPTVDHQSPPRASRGLQIRCPHCSNPVELLCDASYDSITCRSCGSVFNLVDPEAQTIGAPVLQTLGRFELISRLGVGGFGTVWKARDTELDRAVAIKIPRKGQLERAEVDLFLKEARTAAHLRHSNIVPVHEVGREGETIYIVSDFVRGVSLSEWLTGDRPSFRKVAELMITVSEALQHAHQMGVIHRDLKPSNILMDEAGQPHITDFGLAKREVGEITMTMDGQILGTPAYMSPEQAEGRVRWTDRRSDIYSLGVVLFRLLTGELPFRGNAQMQIHQRLTKDPPDPRSLNRFIPHDLSTICLKCLEPDPNRRYSSAHELADELSRYLRGEPVLSRPISSIERALRWGKRKPALAAVAVLTVVLAVAGPLAAASIYYSKHRMAELLVEKDDLIDHFASEKRVSSAKIDDSSKKLNAWEGRINPWEFWPPRTDNPPRYSLANDFFVSATKTLPTIIKQSTTTSEERSQGCLALAMIADSTDHTMEAIDYYQQAGKELVAVLQSRGDTPRRSLALAECYSALARLSAKSDRAAAVNYLASAGAEYQKLATEHKVQVRYQVAWLETEIASAALLGFDSAKEHLARVAEINKSLAGEWPKDLTAAYETACYLTLHEALLSPPNAANVPATAHPQHD